MIELESVEPLDHTPDVNPFPPGGLDERLVSVIQASRARPKMFFREGTLTSLASFTDGFQSAAAQFGLPLQLDLRDLTRFVEDRLRMPGTTADWHSLILLACDGDHTQALQRFYDLFDAYLADRYSEA